MKSQNTEANIVAEFMKVFSMVEHEIFNGALYNFPQIRNKTTRKPAKLPDQYDLNTLNRYLKSVTDKDRIDFELPAEIFIEVWDTT